MGRRSFCRRPGPGQLGGGGPGRRQPAAAQVVEIEPGTISGLRVRLCPFIDALLAVGPPRPCESRWLRLSGGPSFGFSAVRAR
jgi:hypothetical protein